MPDEQIEKRHPARTTERPVHVVLGPWRYSVSMAMTWKTPEVNRLNKIRLMNGTLRHFGLPQKAPGVSPAIDGLKVAARDAMRAVIDPLRKSESMRRILRGAIYGEKANYLPRQGREEGGLAPASISS